jgi:hypothetical protein
MNQDPHLLVLWRRKAPQDDDFSSITNALGYGWREGRVKIVE